MATKISNPTVLARIEHEELEQFLRGCAGRPTLWKVMIRKMHELMATTLDKAIENIREIQKPCTEQQRRPRGLVGP